MDDMTMGQRIAAERKKLGLSQEQLGEMYLHADIPLPQMQERDRLELRYRAKLTGGLQKDIRVAGWTVKGKVLTPDSE